MKHNYTKTGKCIWCGREKPDAKFETAPHIVPHSLGGKEIGVDICDDCNHYFGRAPKVGVPSIDLAFKEVFNCFIIFGNNLDENTYKKFHSAFFTYYHKRHTIRIKPNFNSHFITLQFKRGLYEVFLQKYHAVTGRGNLPMFDAVRKYARYGIGNLHCFYAFNNIILKPSDKDLLYLPMNDTVIENMMTNGIYCFWLAGHAFYLEIFPIAFNAKGSAFLRQEAQQMLIPAVGNEKIFEFTDIMQIDLFMNRFHR